MANLATRAIMGESLASLGYEEGLLEEADHVSVKVPVFSFQKLKSVDTILGPEMKSTGEAIGRDKTLAKALFKGLVASGIEIPFEGAVLFTVADKDKAEATDIARGFQQLGFDIYATQGTAEHLIENGVIATAVDKIGSDQENVLSLIEKNAVHFVVNTLTSGNKPLSDGFKIRRAAVEHGIASLTSLDTARAILNVIDQTTFQARPMVVNQEVIR